MTPSNGFPFSIKYTYLHQAFPAVTGNVTCFYYQIQNHWLVLGCEEQIMFYVHSKLRIPEKAVVEHDVHFIINKFFIFQYQCLIGVTFFTSAARSPSQALYQDIKLSQKLA